MIPLTEDNDNLLVIIVWHIRVLDDKRTSHTIHILTLCVRVVPERTDLIRNSKIVQHGVTRSNWTLTNQRWTVHLRGSVLEQAVEVKSSVGIVKTVGQVDLDPVTLIDSNIRPWKFTVTSNDWPFKGTVWVCSTPAGSPVKNMSFGQSSCCKKGGRKN
ncbi:hypothetical protein OGATHE_004446 [Ogataea polymorpha]|uniref:Uncharacterized protein n=1 Tax=Ogataea polymorpha TaxID=460523 RepID=A0A9P8T2E5_9ASCO|nr:hypothetical protein OGATHE_004446 [Ogataea polymorpha]